MKEWSIESSQQAANTEETTARLYTVYSTNNLNQEAEVTIQEVTILVHHQTLFHNRCALPEV